jgi:hypothetical protein
MAEQTLVIRSGTLSIPFEKNYRISLCNLATGRAITEGYLPTVYVPDSNLPEWLHIKVTA